MKFINYSCNDKESVYDAMKRLIATGRAPANSSVSDLRHYSWGDEKQDSSIIGQITVRPGEMYAIILKIK